MPCASHLDGELEAPHPIYSQRYWANASPFFSVCPGEQGGTYTMQGQGWGRPQ